MEEQINQEQIDAFLKQHENQLRASGVPEHLFRAIAVKLENGIFDAGEFFQLLLIEYDEGERDDQDPVFAVQALKEIKATDGNAVFLIDHALTFKADKLREQLEEAPSMINRLGIMMGLDDENKNLETVMQHIWRYSNFYTINAQGRLAEDRSDCLSINQILCRRNRRGFPATVVRHGRARIWNNSQRRTQLSCHPIYPHC